MVIFYLFSSPALFWFVLHCEDNEYKVQGLEAVENLYVIACVKIWQFGS